MKRKTPNTPRRIIRWMGEGRVKDDVPVYGAMRQTDSRPKTERERTTQEIHMRTKRKTPNIERRTSNAERKVPPCGVNEANSRDADLMNSSSLHAIASVAYKEFLHIYRDRRVLLLLLILPPLFVLLFGHAFETSEISDVPAMLINRDNNSRTQRFIDIVLQNKTFRWGQASPEITNESDLLANRFRAALVIPQGWSDSLSAGNPKPLPLYLNGSDINTASAAEGGVQKSMADFQVKERDLIVETLPDEVIELGKKLPVQIRNNIASVMQAWPAGSKVLYNPKSRFIDYVIPGIIGLILQLLTVTLMACTIARERESGTLYQLMVTSLKRGEIVIGKILPYLGVSIVLIAMITLVAGLHFHVRFYQPPALMLICLLFLLCSLALV